MYKTKVSALINGVGAKARNLIQQKSVLRTHGGPHEDITQHVSTYVEL